MNEKRSPLMANIRSTNLRFNLNKDMQKKAWQYLQTMDKKQFRSYSNVIAIALVDYFDRYYRSRDDPYFETREREERFVNQILRSVEITMEKTLPSFLAGCIAGISQRKEDNVLFKMQQNAEITSDRDGYEE